MRWCYIGMGCLYMRLLGALVLHRDGMPIYEATRCAGVRDGMPICEATRWADVLDGMPIYEATRWAGVTSGWDAYI